MIVLEICYLDSNEIKKLVKLRTLEFKNYVIFDSNENSAISGNFYKYVILDSNKTKFHDPSQRAKF